MGTCIVFPTKGKLRKWPNIVESMKGLKPKIMHWLHVQPNENPAVGRNPVGYGLCKFILALTRSGHIYAIDSNSGENLWSRATGHSDWHLSAFLELYTDADGNRTQVRRVQTFLQGCTTCHRYLERKMDIPDNLCVLLSYRIE